MIDCTAIILSGGLNTRMEGKNKAFLKIDRQRFIDRIYQTIKPCFNDFMLITRQPDLYTDLGIETVSDIFQVRSPLAGIHAGLLSMKTEYAFCFGCDTPLIKQEAVKYMLNEISSDADVIVPSSGTYFQPLFAIYSKRCIDPIATQLNNNDLKVDRFYKNISLKKVAMEKIKDVDPELLSFFNVNTSSDLIEAERLLEEDRNL